jgi:hemoglobin/transferrin/lactoferrin receptor protein
MKRKILLLQFLIFTFFYTAGNLSAQEGAVTGKAEDKLSGFPVINAVVKIVNTGLKTETDNNGIFRFEKLSPGIYEIIIEHVAYNTFRKDLTVTEGKNTSLEIKLTSSEIVTGEINVSSVRYEAIVKDIALPVEIVSSEEILRRPVNNISEALSDKPGISLTRDGIWAADISIRGLSKSSVVVLIDGNRVETANDLSARLSLIDVSDISRIEVIKGGVSSLYGTGATGGIVNIFTKNGDFGDKLFFKSSVTGGINTVSNNRNLYLSLNSGERNWYIKLSGSLRDASNTMTASGEIPNSQFSDKNFSAFSGIHPFKDHTLSVSYQNYFAEDVGIPGGYPLFPTNASVTYPTEKRTMFYAEYKINNLSRVLKNISAKYYYQYIFRDVINIPGTIQIKPPSNGLPKQRISVLEITPTGEHSTNGVLMQSGWKISSTNSLTGGIDIWQRDLSTDRERLQKIETYDSSGTTIINTIYKTTGEKPLPDASYRSTGIYAQDETSLINEKLKLVLGGRIDFINVTNQITYQPYYEIINGIINNSPAGQKIIWNEEKANDVSWSGNLGMVYSLKKEIDVTANLSVSFRSPSLEERYQYIDLGNLIRVGNPYLLPENGYFADIGLRIRKDNFNFTGDLFYNIFNNLVAEIPGTYEGRQALIKTNIGDAALYGYDFNVNYNFYKSFTAYGVMSYVRGEDKYNNLNLAQIPPLNGRIGLKFSVLKIIYADINSVLYASQNYTAPGELPTPGYSIFNAELSSTPVSINNMPLSLFGGVENLFNKSYRNHLSTGRGSVTAEPGINFYIKLRLDI